MSAQLHEILYRGEKAMQKIAEARLIFCGAGALGSQLCDNLVRHGATQILIVDRDRVEEHNIGTQVYERDEIGAWKAEALQSRCFRATGIEVEATTKELSEKNATKLLRGADLVFDTFDNSASRRLVTETCRALNVPCLHLGVNTDYGEVMWNDSYRVPNDVIEGNACDYPLARNLLLFIVALGSEAALRFLLNDQKENYSFTLGDLSINGEA
ncbi:MAG TPA: ThiF family adenylyltransferase [Abditibacteriaceae bacterium]|jgi:molybdopterin/thiamine biosynthesis adenylyltransferase